MKTHFLSAYILSNVYRGCIFATPSIKCEAWGLHPAPAQLDPRTRFTSLSVVRATSAIPETPAPCVSKHESNIELGHSVSLNVQRSIIMNHTRLVHYHGMKYKYKHQLNDDDYKDMTQEAMLGLIRAADKFDHCRNVKFATYASWWIRGKMTAYVKRRYKHTAVPPNYIIETPVVHCDQTRELDGADLSQLLTPAECLVLHLRYDRCYPFKRISEKMGLSAYHVTKLHRRALERLRVYMSTPHTRRPHRPSVCAGAKSTN